MFGLNKPKNAAREVDLDKIITHFGQAATFWQTQQQAGILARARFADACRDAGIRPVSISRFDDAWQAMSDDSRIRFSITLSAFDFDEVKSRLSPVADAEHWLNALCELAGRLQLLTAEMILQSDVRLEEFSRHFCSTVGLKIKGELEVKSAARLHDIDFQRLMNEADAARSSAEDRMAYLRKMQKEQEATRRTRRGKW